MREKLQLSVRATKWLYMCLSTCAVAGLLSSHNMHAADRSIAVDDLIGVRKIGKIAISPDGQTVAYLVIRALISTDSYEVRLVVTCTKDPGKHREIVRLETPAARSKESSYDVDIGSYLTAGLVFAWTTDGRGIVYGIPDGINTRLNEYLLKEHRTMRLSPIRGTVTQLSFLENNDLAYSDIVPARRHLAMVTREDPSYRYDDATFRPNEINPWRREGIFSSGPNPWLDSRNLSCYKRSYTSGKSAPIPCSALQQYDPMSSRTSSTVSVLGTAHFDGKLYDGAPIVEAYDSPDGQSTLYRAKFPEAETVSMHTKSSYFVENAKGQRSRLLLFETSGWQEDWISGPIFWSSDSRAVYCFRRSLERTRLVRFDALSGTESTIVDTTWGLNGSLSMSVEGRYIYTTRERPNVAKQLCRIDLSTGEMTLVDDVNRQLGDIKMPSYSPVRESNQYGHQLTGYLFLPPGFHGERRLPFVAIKGQPYSGFCDGGTGLEFPGMVMAMRGFAILFFLPDTMRFGSSQNGNAAYSLLDYESPLENLTSAVDDLSRKGWIDPTRTGIAGLSYGADLVNYAAGFSNTFSVGAATTGDVEAPANYFILGGALDKVMFSESFGLPYPDTSGLPAWKKVSTSLNASRSHMPLLFQPPDSEAWPTVPQHIAWQHAGLPVDTYVYPDEGHMKIHPLNRHYVMTRNVQWFDFWLMDHEDSNGEFAAQFSRWRDMRKRWESDNNSVEKVRAPGTR